MLAAIVFFVILCSGCAFISAFFKCRFEQAIVVVLFMLIVFLYFWGLFDLLPIGTFVTTIVAGAALCATTVRTARRHEFRKFSRLFFTPGFLVFTFAFLVILFSNYGRLVTNRDDFSHWANTVKRMSILDRFATSPDSFAQFPNYPPAMSLVQYYLQSIHKAFGNGFSEWLLYIPFELSAVMLLLPSLSCLYWKREAIFSMVILLLCTCCIPGILYSDVYRTLMIDPIVGLVAGYAFSILLCTRERSILDNTGLVFSCVVLTLLKLPGIYFATCITIAVALDTVAKAKKNSTRFLSEAEMTKPIPTVKKNQSTEHNEKKQIVRRYATAVNCGVATLAAYISWELWLNNEGVQRRFEEPIDLSILWRIFTGENTGYRSSVLMTFIKNVFISKQKIGTLSFFNIELSWFTLFLGLVAIATVVSIFLLRKHEHSPKQLYIILGVLFSTCVLYTFGLAICYLFKFNQSEAAQLASFNRYMNIPLMMILTALYRPIARFVCDRGKTGLRIGVALILAMSLVAPYKELASFVLRRSVTYSQEVRAPFTAITMDIPERIQDQNAKICIVTDGNRDYCIQLLNFCMAPIIVSDYSLDVLDVSDHDLYYDGFSAKDWKRALKEDCFDYVLIVHAPLGFREKYAEVFLDPNRISDGTLFSVDVTTGRLAYFCNVSENTQS